MGDDGLLGPYPHPTLVVAGQPASGSESQRAQTMPMTPDGLLSLASSDSAGCGHALRVGSGSSVGWSVGYEPVAHAGLGDEVSRLGGVGLDFLADL